MNILLFYGMFFLYRARRHPQMWKFARLLLLPLALAYIFHVMGSYPIDDYMRRHLWLVAPLTAIGAWTLARAWGDSLNSNRFLFKSDEEEAAGKHYWLLPAMILGIALPTWIWMATWDREPEKLDPAEFSLRQTAWQGVREYLEREVKPGDVVIADFPVAVYFFEGEHNIYRARWQTFPSNTNPVLAIPIGGGEMRTLPAQRYIVNEHEYYQLARDVLENVPRQGGGRVFLIAWELTNPALVWLRDEKKAKDVSPDAFRQYFPEAAIFPIAREPFENEVLKPDGDFDFLRLYLINH